MPSASAASRSDSSRIEAKDDDRALLGLELAQRVVEEVTVDDERGRIGDRHIVERVQLHLDDPPASMPSHVDTAMHGEAVQPGVEPARVAQPGQVPPGSHHRLLDRVARELRVPEDESGGRVQARQRPVHEQAEGVLIALGSPVPRVLAGPRSPQRSERSV